MEKSLQPGFISSVVINQATISCNDLFLCSEGYQMREGNWSDSCEELTDWKRPWCWEGLGAGGEGDDQGWDGWMASRTRWTWVWVNSGRWWWTGRPGVLRFMGLQRVGHDEWLDWTELSCCFLDSYIGRVGWQSVVCTPLEVNRITRI